LGGVLLLDVELVVGYGLVGFIIGLGLLVDFILLLFIWYGLDECCYVVAPLDHLIYYLTSLLFLLMMFLLLSISMSVVIYYICVILYLRFNSYECLDA